MNSYTLTPTESRIVYALVEQRERLAREVNECIAAIDEHADHLAHKANLPTGKPSITQQGDVLVLTVAPPAEPVGDVE